jgi:CRP-like cAMP-binding protein
VKQGEMSGIRFFVISEGEASVSVDGREVRRLGPGDHFGEFALISRQVRAATVTAETPLTCQAIDFWDFRSFANDHPEILWKLLEHVVGLVANERDRSGPAPAQTI